MSKAKVLCLKCGNEWEYRGLGTRVTCPKCKTKITIKGTDLRYMSMDLKEHGQGIINAVNAGKSFAILDCVGNNVVDVSIID